LQDTIAWAGSEIENVKDNKKKLMLENEMLQAQLDIVTDKSNLRIGILYISSPTIFLIIISNSTYKGITIYKC